MSRRAKPRVAGLVLNYNGREVTLDTLASLAELRYPELDLFVVDNGSTDDSVAAIEERFPEVPQLRVRANRGISWGLDHGMQWAHERGYDYQLLMNNDIFVDPGMLDHMVAAAEADPGVGCVGPKSYYHSDPERLWSTGGLLPFRETVTRERGDGERDRGQYDRDEEVPYVNGCAMLVRRQVVDRIGFWDPAYFLGVEDADYCVRMKDAGFRCLYAHRARLWHRISHSLGVYKPTRTFHTGRSTAIYLRKHATRAQWLRVVLALAVALPLAWLRELPKGNQRAAVEKLRGFREGLRVELEPVPRRFDDWATPPP